MHLVIFILIATIFEASGDAIIRKAIYDHTGVWRVGFFVAGAVLLFGYVCALNLAPVEFGQVVGLYIATLFIVWQVVNYLTFDGLPNLSTMVGGALIIAGWVSHYFLEDELNFAHFLNS